MANPEHLALLRQDVEAWNEWRQTNPDIEKPSLREADLREADLRKANLSGAYLFKADLSGADLRGADLSGADLFKANLGAAGLCKAHLRGANLRSADFRLVNLFEADLSGADLSGAYLFKADLRGADLFKVNLGAARLCKAHLRGADLSEADLRGADLREADLRGADLRGADLYRADLRGANLRRADLYGADLRRADLSVANLGVANLGMANLSEANLSDANLSGADLREADLRRVSLSRTNLSGADLRNANLGWARLWNTIFPDINLAEVKGLNTCHHEGPSHLNFRTLQQSDILPLVFLRGCGLTDQLIDYLSSLLNQPIQYCSCCISYSSKDEDFAQRLHADLQNKDVRCWFAPKDTQGGQKPHEQTGEAIRFHEKLLLVLSEHSMNSEWVKTEIAKAQQREVYEKRQVLFPIRLVDFKTIQQWKYFDSDIGKDFAKEIREYFIPDFSNWKSYDAYQQAFDRLLRDLKPELERKPEML